jgi:hypothetical protein
VLSTLPADLDGDGDLDLVIQQKPRGHGLVLLENDGSATFSIRAQLKWMGLDQVLDMNDDGVVDLVGITLNQRVVIAPGLGDWTYGERTRVSMGRDYPHVPNHVAAADLDADDVMDLVTTNREGGSVSTRLGNGDGTYGPLHREDRVGGEPLTSTPVDLDLDGKPDLVLHDEGRISVLRGNGDGSFRAPAMVDVGVTFRRYMYVADVDHDGRSDVVVLDDGSPDTVSSALNASGDGL